MTQTYPDDAVQSYVGEWWCKDEQPSVQRGRLAFAFMPYIQQTARVLQAEGRTSPTEHREANYRISTFDVRSPPRAPALPVAGMPSFAGEFDLVFRTKRRPVLILNCGGAEVPKSIVSSSARWQTTKTLLVAPYFGAERDGERGGWAPAFVDRIRRAEYQQYVWDNLPIGGSAGSILRLDQSMAIGADPASYELSKYYLSKAAMEIIDEWRYWLDHGEPHATAFIREFRRDMRAVWG